MSLKTYLIKFRYVFQGFRPVPAQRDTAKTLAGSTPTTRNSKHYCLHAALSSKAERPVKHPLYQPKGFTLANLSGFSHSPAGLIRSDEPAKRPAIADEQQRQIASREHVET